MVGQYALQEGILVCFAAQTSRVSPEFRERLVVPVSYRPRVLEACHEDIFSGHLGEERTMMKVGQRFFWKGFRKSVIEFIQSCSRCQTYKNPSQWTRAPLVPLPIPGPFERMGVDVVGPLCMTERGNKYVLVFTDYFTKWAEAIPMADQKAVTVAQAFVEKIVCVHGCPVELLSDRGVNFLSDVMLQVCHLLDTYKVTATAYHPQTDGLTERFNKTLCSMLAMFVNESHTDWDLLLPFVLFAYRTSVQKSTRETPFYMVFGRDARLPIDAALQAYRGVTRLT